MGRYKTFLLLGIIMVILKDAVVHLLKKSIMTQIRLLRQKTDIQKKTLFLIR